MSNGDLLKKYKIPTDIQKLTSVLQEAQKQDLVFYNLLEGQESSFQNRYEKSQKPFVILNSDPQIEFNGLIVENDDFQKLKKSLLDQFYPLNSNLKLAGVTGTNGKTSTVFLAMQIAEQIGKRALCLGTYGLRNKDGILEGNLLTTPGEIEFRRILYEFGNVYDVLFFEYSSHALEQNRIGDLRIDISAWTNFGQDHLDYHKTLEAYFEAKLKIASFTKDHKILINPQETELFHQIPTENREAVKSLDPKGLPSHLKAGFNYLNLNLAFFMNQKLFGFKKEQLDFSQIKTPDGRFQVLENNNSIIIIDYAHTPDAFGKVISTAREIYPDYRIKILFGCGGDRDKSKRPLMAQMAEKADGIYITSDNPRTEDPNEIIQDILQGLSKTDFKANINRKEMIHLALKELKEKEVLLLLGKGAEDYQEINGERLPFSDIEIVEEFWRLN